jgi:hypothetical protein
MIILSSTIQPDHYAMSAIEKRQDSLNLREMRSNKNGWIAKLEF